MVIVSRMTGRDGFFLGIIVVCCAALVAAAVVSIASRELREIGPVLDTDPACVTYVDDGNGQPLPIECYPK